jgi:hypothetical protein
MLNAHEKIAPAVVHAHETRLACFLHMRMMRLACFLRMRMTRLGRAVSSCRILPHACACILFGLFFFACRRNTPAHRRSYVDTRGANAPTKNQKSFLEQCETVINSTATVLHCTLHACALASPQLPHAHASCCHMRTCRIGTQLHAHASSL